MSKPSAADQPIREILVIKPSSLGDVVHTLPAVALVKKRWPEARLRWLVNPEWAPLLEGNPAVDEVVIFPRRKLRGLPGLLHIGPWARETRRQVQADLVLDFQGLLRSGLIAKLCRGQGGTIVGLSDAREGSRHFYDQVAQVNSSQHAVERYLALVASLGIDTSGVAEWPLPAGTAPKDFDASQPFLLLHPFSRGAGKSLEVKDLSKFVAAMAPHRVVIAGRSDDVFECPPHVVNLLNQTTLGELIWLLRRATFVVSVDSGPMHIAAAITPNVLSIHFWSDPRKVGPYRPEAWIWRDGVVFRKRDLDTPQKHLPCEGIEEVAGFTRAQFQHGAG